MKYRKPQQDAFYHRDESNRLIQNIPTKIPMTYLLSIKYN